ncbi:hypothetical protein KL934_000199 [Ogataea polymorpha]|nr:hypothetical protein KL934_000199 [Ogataea polymorpha]
MSTSLFNRFTPQSGETSLHWKIVGDSIYYVSPGPAPSGPERVETGSFQLRRRCFPDQQTRQADQRFAAQALGQERHPAAGATPQARDPALGHAARRLDQDPDPPAARPGNFAGHRSDPAEIGAAGRVSGFGARRKASDKSQRISASDSQRLCAPVRHANPDPADRKSAGTHCQGPFRTGELLAARAVGSAAVARHSSNHIPDNGQER